MVDLTNYLEMNSTQLTENNFMKLTKHLEKKDLNLGNTKFYS